MERNYCVIDQNTNIVVNVIVWDGNLDHWSPPENTLCIQADGVCIGWIYNPQDNSFINPFESKLNSITSNTQGPNVITI